MPHPCSSVHDPKVRENITDTEKQMFALFHRVQYDYASRSMCDSVLARVELPMNLSQEEPAGIEAPMDFSAALRWVDGDRELLTELIAIFLEDCPKRLQELDHAVKEDNANGVRQAAHSLKGMVAGFQARSAHGLANEMEILGKAGDLSQASDLLSIFLLEFDRVMNYLKVANWRGDELTTDDGQRNARASKTG
jgi:HPt (histidine-containing phosphotransfer) domain-containing protein